MSWLQTTAHPQWPLAWSYLHLIVQALEAVETVGPSSAATSLAELAPEIVSRRPAVIGDFVMAFGLFHAELGDFDRANELVEGAFGSFLLSAYMEVRARQGLPPDWDSLTGAGIGARIAKQPHLIREEIDYWTAASEARQSSV